ncbi:MAG: DNA methylase [Armatimonadetes bacterium]|nr:DNA methylase [Armatimonadota bacterium]
MGDSDGRERKRRLRALLAEQVEGMRGIQGFPGGDVQRILALSIPREYTACPNPFIADWLEAAGTARDAPVTCEPLAADVSEGKADPIYRGQIYHTKVPPAAVARYIEHYCPPGGVVFDGFCGSGMTGVAARLTGRRAILCDLSPAATAIAASLCLPVRAEEFAALAAELVRHLREVCGHLYTPPDGRSEMEYVIWSEVYRCPRCSAQSPFSEMGFDLSARKPRKAIQCPDCGAQLGRSDLRRVLDEAGKTVERPVRIKYAGQPGERDLSDSDLDLIARAREDAIPFGYPEGPMMGREPGPDGWGQMWRRGYHSGVHRVADFYYPRTLWVLAAALDWIGRAGCSDEARHALQTTVINTSLNLTRMRRAYQGVIPLVLYFPRLRRECNAILVLERKLRAIGRAMATLPQGDQRSVMISTQSATDLRNIPDASVDYIFTDPPFGGNIIYSEVNYLWESWLGVTTNQHPEAIVSRTQRKGQAEYAALMTDCLREFHRVLKPGGWITVEFHNSDDSIWAAIQSALQESGFEVADVRILDKQAEAFKAAVSQVAVRKDLVISALRPGPEKPPLCRSANCGNLDVWQFVAEHLGALPEDDGRLSERTPHMLFNRMVAWCLMNGQRVPMSSGAFYQGLRERFVEIGGRYYLRDRNRK